jgi:hypothetical protein
MSKNLRALNELRVVTPGISSLGGAQFIDGGFAMLCHNTGGYFIGKIDPVSGNMTNLVSLKHMTNFSIISKTGFAYLAGNYFLLALSNRNHYLIRFSGQGQPLQQINIQSHLEYLEKPKDLTTDGNQIWMLTHSNIWSLSNR